MGLVGSKYAKVGVDVRDSFTALNLSLNFSDQTNSFLVWRSGCRGDVRVATIEVVDESWLTSPMKDRRAVWSVGVGKSAMDLKIDGSM